MSKHTPGKWSFVWNEEDHSHNCRAVSIYADNGDAVVYIADVYRGYVGSEEVTDEELEANAALIAQAWRIPDLLAVVDASRELRDYRRTMVDGNNTSHAHGRLFELEQALDEALASVKDHTA